MSNQCGIFLCRRKRNSAGVLFCPDYPTDPLLRDATFWGRLVNFESNRTLNRRLSLYAGIYADYGLNDIVKNRNKVLAGYDASHPKDLGLKGTLASVYPATDGQMQKFSDKNIPVGSRSESGHYIR